MRGVFWLIMVAALPGLAQAVSLGKLEVTSHLGEPFYAEAPLALSEGEDLANVDVEIASPADYRILEVYRDPALNAIRTDVVRDRRGARIELTSRAPIDSPFFNLVLKVKHRRATHFKKYPVFLDLPKAVKPDLKAPPAPVVSAQEQPDAVGKPVATPVYRPATPPAAAKGGAEDRESAGAAGFKPFDGWARISRYGPMVYGDTISTVAERLRVDDRFTLQQVMVALFYKNRDKFDQDNINLIKAGTYLDVPRAVEVERISPSEARALIAEHEKRWAELKRQPRYAAVAEAQRTRYTKRVRMGKQASGVAAAPIQGHDGDAVGQSSPEEKGNDVSGEVGLSSSKTPVEQGMSNGATAAKANASLAKELAALKQENQTLKTRLDESEKKIKELSAKASKGNLEEAAALEARLKKLQLKLARMQAELDKARNAAAAQAGSGGMDWLTMGLGGLVVLLLGAVGFLLRRQPKHPAEMLEASAPSTLPQETAVSAPMEEVEEIEVEEADVDALEKTTKVDADTIRDFTDSIPDLTDEDTGSMEPFTEEAEEEPDPNVDYLAEADVYMRYGMEDEALQQVNLAMRLHPEKADVHVKKAQVLRAKGDDAGFEAAVEAAKQQLAGEELERFNAALAELEAEAQGQVDSGELADTLPPTSAESLIGEDAASSDSGLGDEPTVSQSTAELDFDFGDAVISTEDENATVDLDEALGETVALEKEESSVSSEEQAGAEMDESESDSQAVSEENAASEVDATAELDFNLDDLEATLSGIGEAGAGAGGSDGEQSDEMTSAESQDDDIALDFDLGNGQDTVGEAAEQASPSDSESDESGKPEEAPQEVSPASLDDAGGLDFDLSDIELPKGEVEQEPVSAQIETGDLEKTVAMDWSKDTSDLADLATTVMEESASEQKSESPSGESSGDFTDSLRLDASDLGGDLEPEAVADEVEGDFTSTIRTTLDDIGPTEADGDEDFTSTGDFAIDETVAMDAGKANGDDSPLLDLDLDDDADATQKLDSLLKEFTDDDEDRKDQG